MTKADAPEAGTPEARQNDEGRHGDDKWPEAGPSTPCFENGRSEWAWSYALQRAMQGVRPVHLHTRGDDEA